MDDLTLGTIGRRVVIGKDSDGRSAVVRDDVSQARTTRPTGAVVTEIWRQEAVPAHYDDDGTRAGEMLPMPPATGASMRIFTLPPNGPSEPRLDAERLAFGAANVAESASGPVLHRTDSLYVATVVQGRAELVLETNRVLLGPGDSFVLPGSFHAWCNPFQETAMIVAAVFPLATDG